MNEQGTGNRNEGSGNADGLSASWSSRLAPKPWKKLNPGPIPILLLAAGLATFPQYIFTVSCGHDFDFHLVSWIDALQSWREHIVYPHWAPSPNYRAGEPRFIFYPPITWMLGAFLGVFMRWRLVVISLTFLLFFATGWATRTLARQVLREGPATLAGCFSIFAGYTLFTAYERSAFAEFSGGFWLPLLILLVLREGKQATQTRPSLLRRAFDGSAFLLALVVAGAWLSNAPLGVMASYLLAALAVAVAALSRSWAPVLRSVFALALGLGLSAFYLVPAAVEQKWVDIRQATEDPGELIQNSFLFGHHADPQLELHDLELMKVSFIGAVMVGVALLAIFFCWRLGRLPGARRWWLPLAFIPIAIFLLQLPVSLPVWNALPKLRYLQFPWRWLAALEAPAAIFVASALWMNGRWRRRAALGAALVYFVFATFFAAYGFFQICDSEDTPRGMLAAYRAGQGFEGTDEYAPVGADNSLVAMNLPAACLVSDPTVTLGAGDPDLAPQWSPDQHTCGATFSFAPVSRGASEHWRIQASVPHSGYLVLRLRRYPAWQVRLNGQPVTSMPQRQDGLMTIPVPVGSLNLTIDWTTTADVRLGRGISLLSLLLVTALGAWELRSSKRHLS